MHRTRTQEEWWHQNHFGSQLSCMGLESVYFFGSHEGMVDSKYNLIATVNHRASKKNDDHYTAVSKSPMLGSWYKYDNDNVNLVKFVKGNNNSKLMDFQTTSSILFYVDVRYVSVCYNSLRNDDKVIDHTGGGIETIHWSHKRPPSIVHLEDDTLSLSSSNTLALLSSNNSSRSLTSVRLKTNSDDDDLFSSSSQSTKNIKGYSKYKMSENCCANYVLSFCDWAMGTTSERCYNNPHHEWCVGKMCGAKNVTLQTRRMWGESAQYLSNRLANATLFRGESWWSNFCRQHNECYQNYVQLRARWFMRKESRCMLGSFGMPKSHWRVLTMLQHATAIIILIH